MKLPPLENLGSLITYKQDGADHCLGYLMDFREHGVYDPTFGRIPVSPEHATAHNAALSKAELDGLDDNCAVGQGGTFYLVRGNVQTFNGAHVATAMISGRSITFNRGGKTFRGRSQKDADCFNFRRVR